MRVCFSTPPQPADDTPFPACVKTQNAVRCGMNSKRIEARLSDELDARFEAWRQRQEFPPSRAEAARHAIERLLEFSDRAREEVGE
jgi:hypothetical protein